jgi:hypothetical protein
MAGRQQTALPQQRHSKDATPHPHQPGAQPDPPRPAPARSGRHQPAKAKFRSPLLNRISYSEVPLSILCGWNWLVKQRNCFRGSLSLSLSLSLSCSLSLALSRSLARARACTLAVPHPASVGVCLLSRQYVPALPDPSDPTLNLQARKRDKAT